MLKPEVIFNCDYWSEQLVLRFMNVAYKMCSVYTFKKNLIPSLNDNMHIIIRFTWRLLIVYAYQTFVYLLVWYTDLYIAMRSDIFWRQPSKKPINLCPLKYSMESVTIDWKWSFSQLRFPFVFCYHGNRWCAFIVNVFSLPSRKSIRLFCTLADWKSFLLSCTLVDTSFRAFICRWKSVQLNLLMPWKMKMGC